MLITIPEILDAEALAEVQASLKAVAWRDGRITAGAQAARVKKNRQADMSTRTGAALRRKLHHAVTTHPVFEAAAQPRRLSALVVSCAGEGEGYGLHVDNAVMDQGGEKIRTDLSFTLFLSDPESYEGGELTIDWAGMTQSIKLPAGSLVLYPSTTLHRVETVTSGERMVCVGWIESELRTTEQREILFDLANLRASLNARLPEEAGEHLMLSKVMANLRRLWAET